MIVWASLQKNVFVGVDVMVAEPWGVATLVDIYISFTLIVILIACIEKSLMTGILMGISTYMLGSLVPLVYTVVRYKKIEALFKKETNES